MLYPTGFLSYSFILDCCAPGRVFSADDTLRDASLHHLPCGICMVRYPRAPAS